MPTQPTAESTLFPLADIRVPPERQRADAQPDQSLLTSMEATGLLNPIVIHADGTLVAGERRFKAATKLGWTHIRATIFERLSPLEATMIELQENLARKQLTWQEEAKAVALYHRMRQDTFPAWTQMGTATDLGITQGTVSKYCLVAEELGDPDVHSCQTFQGAFNLISARADRARIAAQSRGLSAGMGAGVLTLPPLISPNATREERTAALLNAVNVQNLAGETISDLDANIANIQAGRVAAEALRLERAREATDDIIINTDFIDWAASYTGPKFDVLHVDFPYGKDYAGAGTRRTGNAHIAPLYADNPDIYLGLVDAFLTLQDNFAFPVAHCIFWFDMQYYAWTVEQFEARGWRLVQPFPLIWTKSYQGIAADTKRRPRHCYETALMFSRGDRKIVKLEKDHFECTLDEKLHLNQKPQAMLRHFLSLVVDEHTAVLDPTCGSGSALVAALALKANRVLGLELDPSNAEVARFLLQRHHQPAEANDATAPTS